MLSTNRQVLQVSLAPVPPPSTQAPAISAPAIIRNLPSAFGTASPLPLATPLTPPQLLGAAAPEVQQALSIPVDSAAPAIRNYEAHYFSSRELSEKPSVIKDIENQLELAEVDAQTLVLLLLINEDGNVDKVELEKANLSARHAQTVVNTFMRMTFHAGKIDGVAVKSQLKIEVKLENSMPPLPPLRVGGVK